MNINRWLLSSFLCLTCVACQQKTYHQNENVVFGTIYHITYSATKDFQRDIDAELAKFDDALSTFNPNSTLSKFNASGIEPFDLSKEFWMWNVVKKSLEISALTHGAFDITVGPLVDLWGFGIKDRSNPDQAQIEETRAYVGYSKIHLRDKMLTKDDARMRLDCSAVAKGYACDVIANLLKSKGITNFLVEIGGEMVLSGHNAEGLPWNIGINKPVEDSTSTNMELEKRIRLTNKSMATSGNYRNFYVKQGKKYAHTIDPKTGYPVQHNLLSATIIANDCLTADALATACMVLGADSALAIVERTANVEGLFISADKNGGHLIQMTSGMKAFTSR